MSLFSLLILMVLQSVSTNLWCRKWAVVLWQEMKNALDHITEPSFKTGVCGKNQTPTRIGLKNGLNSDWLRAVGV
jgi:hypothetical protein